MESASAIAVTVTDVDRAIAFYRDTLSIPFLFQVPNMGFFDCGGMRLMLTGSEKPGEQFSSVLYFKVPDIHAAFEAVFSFCRPNISGFQQPPRRSAAGPLIQFIFVKHRRTFRCILDRQQAREFRGLPGD
jgi:catechol 2,3-dioxygenase-like lactoylglutathione lyase family enzyme